MIRCDSCGLVRVHPLPSDEELAALYFGDYYGRSRDEVGTAGRMYRWFLEGRCRRIHGKRAAGRLLDVGCGSGEFLIGMQRLGWEVSGVESSHAARESLPAELRARVFQRIEDVTTGPFDVITLWHVLEHLRSPDRDLAGCRALLKEGGLLYVAVPNFASWEARLGRDRWFHLDVPRHLYHFGPATLTALLQQAGFRVQRVRHFSWTYNVFGTFQTLMNFVVPERNFLYNRWKRRTDYGAKLSARRYLAYQGLSLMAMPPILATSAVFAAVAACFRRSGTMEIEASLAASEA